MTEEHGVQVEAEGEEGEEERRGEGRRKRRINPLNLQPTDAVNVCYV